MHKEFLPPLRLRTVRQRGEWYAEHMEWQAVIEFWFKETKPEQRFKKSAAFDRELRKRFLDTYWAVARGEMADWRKNPKGRLAEIIVLDQFARNMFRGLPQTFAYDALALALAQEAIRSGAEKKLNAKERWFLYMPFMHSESKKIQKESLRLFKQLGNKQVLGYAKVHKKIVDRFGRYPHRNKTLGRKSAAAEVAFMRTHHGF